MERSSDTSTPDAIISAGRVGSSPKRKRPDGIDRICAADSANSRIETECPVARLTRPISEGEVHASFSRPSAQDMDASVRELNRAVTDLGMVTGMFPTYFRYTSRSAGDPYFDPIFLL